MATNENTRGGGVGSMLVTLVYLLVGLSALIGVFFIAKPFLTPEALHDVFTLPTAVVDVSRPASVPQLRPQAPAQQPDAPAVDVNQAIANYNATQTALYPQPNTDTLPPNAPAVEYGSKSNTLEGPGNGIVPTSEPIDQTVNDQFGSKSKPVNIQETHQCLHAQVWVDGRGCKNPTPTR
jgi:hypothetical protein